MPGSEWRSRRDHLVDLVAGQLAAFAGLGALCDLDLQHLGVDQVMRRDAETARRNLLDLADAVGAVTRLVLAAFAGIGTPAELVHGLRQGFVRLGRQRAERHAGRIETRQDILGRFDLVDLDAFAVSAASGRAARSAGGLLTWPRIFSTARSRRC